MGRPGREEPGRDVVRPFTMLAALRARVASVEMSAPGPARSAVITVASPPVARPMTVASADPTSWSAARPASSSISPEKT